MDFRRSIPFVLLALVLAACAQTQEVTCNKPYIKVGTSCCLDVNDNAICDQDEPKVEKEKPSEALRAITTQAVANITKENATLTQKASEKPQQAKKQLDEIQKAVVTIKGYSPYEYVDEKGNQIKGEGEFTGSGFIVKDNGEIITNSHVVEQYISFCTISSNSKCYLKARTIDEQEHDLEWLSYNWDWDFAVLRVKAPTRKFDFLEISGNSGKVGDAVHVLGAPEGYEFSVTRGIISQKDRDSLQRPDDRKFSKYLQTDAAVNSGNSGGPIVNEEGKVVAVATFGYLLEEGLNFGLQSEEVKRLYFKTFNDTQLVLRKTNYLNEHSYEKNSKEISTQKLNNVDLITHEERGEVEFRSFDVSVANKKNETVRLCFDVKLVSWLGLTGYDRESLFKIELKPNSNSNARFFPNATITSDYTHFYVVETRDCDTKTIYGRAFGPGVYLYKPFSLPSN